MQGLFGFAQPTRAGVPSGAFLAGMPPTRPPHCDILVGMLDAILVPFFAINSCHPVKNLLVTLSNGSEEASGSSDIDLLTGWPLEVESFDFF
jgi:hypothetical protein